MGLIDGLLAAGRHISCDANSHGFMREIPQCWLTGHAAGVGAAVAANRGVQPREVDVSEVKAILREQVFELPRPIPIYMTYLTVESGPGGVVFRPDPYGFDALAMPQMGFGRTA